MELDDLNRAWSEYDPMRDVGLTRKLLDAVRVSRPATAMNRLRRWLLCELVLTLGVALWTGSFLWDHVNDPRFFIPAAALHLGVIALIIACVRQIVAIGRLDFAAPVVAVQERLETLRMQRIRLTKWTLLLAPLAWTPLFIAVMKGVFRVNVYTHFSHLWMAANAVFGLVAVGVGLWLCKRYAGRFGGSPFLDRLMRDVAGQNMNEALDFVRSLSHFEGR